MTIEIPGTISPLTHERLNTVIYCLFQQDQFDYASHSFRIGATITATAGVPTWLIKKLGRWTRNAITFIVQQPLPMPQTKQHGMQMNQKLTIPTNIRELNLAGTCKPCHC